jgi:hypothetical protein
VKKGQIVNFFETRFICVKLREKGHFYHFLRFIRPLAPRSTRRRSAILHPVLSLSTEQTVRAQSRLCEFGSEGHSSARRTAGLVLNC